MGDLLERVRSLFHQHRFDIVYGTMEPTGVTLGWDFRPTTEYSMLERCTCGAERRSKGWVLPRKAEEVHTAIASVRTALNPSRKERGI